MKNTANTSEVSTIRKRALVLQKKRRSLPFMTCTDKVILEHVYELEVHQIELELQNKALILESVIVQDQLKKYKDAKEKAEESDRLKSAFLSNMSNEISKHMNGIMGFTKLLKKPVLSIEKQLMCISMIEKGSTRLLNIFNDFISITKIESRQLNVHNSICNLNEQIEYIYTLFKPEVELKGMKLFFKDSLPTKVADIQTDSEKLLAILTHLVNNAIKYSDKGTIEFGYSLKPAGVFLEVEFFVKDTGRGIPQDKLKTIFDRYIQVPNDNKSAMEGVGLGLALSKAYVEMLGGEIWVESEEGKGSTFYFTLPYNSKFVSTTFNI